MNKKTILIAEDELVNGMYLESLFIELGCNVLELAPTGEEAVKSALENNPDGIIMDINLLGEMNGIEAARKISAQKQIPIFFFTGYDDRKYREQCEMIPNSGYYVKPISLNTINELFQKIDSCKKE